MGQDVDRTTFSRRDRHTYRTKLQRCLDALAIMLREHPFARDEPMTGVEVELNLVDEELVPALRGRQVLDAIDGDEFQLELGRWNLELNLPPRPLPGDQWRHFEHQLTHQLDLARSAADSCGARLAVIGILPTLESRHLVVGALSAEDRYAALNEQLMSARGEPIRLDIAGDDPSGRHAVAPDHLAADFDSIAPEAACTSMQLHLQVHPDAFAGYWNAAQCIAGVQLAVGANSPFLLHSRLWAETRIPLFEQSCDVRTVELRNQGVRPRVWFGERWITSVFDLFSENGRYFPVLLPQTEDIDPILELKEGRVPQLDELRLHNGTIWRWNRPVYDVADGVPHVRVENRVLPAGTDRGRHGGQRPVLLRAATRTRRSRPAAVDPDVVRGGAGELHDRRPARPRRAALLAGFGLDAARRAGAAQTAARRGGRPRALGCGRRGDRPLPLGHRAPLPLPPHRRGLAAGHGGRAGAAAAPTARPPCAACSSATWSTPRRTNRSTPGPSPAPRKPPRLGAMPVRTWPPPRSARLRDRAAQAGPYGAVVAPPAAGARSGRPR